MEFGRFDFHLLTDEARLIASIEGARIDRIIENEGAVYLLGPDPALALHPFDQIAAGNESGGVEVVRLAVRAADEDLDGRYLRSERNTSRPIADEVVKVEVVHSAFLPAPAQGSAGSPAQVRQWLSVDDERVQHAMPLKCATRESGWPQRAIVGLDLGLVLHFSSAPKRFIGTDGQTWKVASEPFEDWAQARSSRGETFAALPLTARI